LCLGIHRFFIPSPVRGTGSAFDFQPGQLLFEISDALIAHPRLADVEFTEGLHALKTCRLASDTFVPAR
jgi:hypothetical protein